MNRLIFRRAILAGLLSAALGLPAYAASVSDQIVAQLKNQGFSEFSVSTTLLGRIRILATSSEYQREIIIDRRTGEILRDLTTTLGGEAVAGQISGSSGSGGSGQGSGSGSGGGNSGSGSGGDDDHDDDDDNDDDNDDDEDDDEDDDDEDNSGSGSGSNSGSGGGDDDDSDDGDSDDD